MRIEDAVVNDPILTGFWIDVQAVDNTYTFDDAMRVPAVLSPHQLDLVGEVLV